MKKILIDFEFDQEQETMKLLASELACLVEDLIADRGYQVGNIRSSFPELDELEAQLDVDEFNRRMVDLVWEEMELE